MHNCLQVWSLGELSSGSWRKTHTGHQGRIQFGTVRHGLSPSVFYPCLDCGEDRPGRFGRESREEFCFGLHHSWKPIFLSFPTDSNVCTLIKAWWTTVCGCGTAYEDACPEWALGHHHLCDWWGMFLMMLYTVRLHFPYFCETLCVACC